MLSSRLSPFVRCPARGGIDWPSPKQPSTIVSEHSRETRIDVRIRPPGGASVAQLGQPPSSARHRWKDRRHEPPAWVSRLNIITMEFCRNLPKCVHLKTPQKGVVILVERRGGTLQINTLPCDGTDDRRQRGERRRNDRRYSWSTRRRRRRRRRRWEEAEAPSGDQAAALRGPEAAQSEQGPRSPTAQHRRLPAPHLASAPHGPASTGPQPN